MKFTDWLWTNKTPEEIRREAFQPNHDERECDVAEAPSVEAVPGTDGDAAQLDPASAAEGEARSTARVFVTHYCTWDDIGRLVKSGYGLKYIGRGYVEAVMK